MSKDERRRNAVTPTAVLIALLLTWLSIYASRDEIGQSKLPFGFALAVLVAVVAGTRPLWDPDFTQGRRYGQRGWHVFWKYYGPIGIAVSVLINVLLLMIGGKQESSSWYGAGFFIVAGGVGVALFAIPMTPLRQIGSGVLVGIGLLPLAGVLLLIAVLTVPALVVYVPTSIISWVRAKSSGKPPAQADSKITSRNSGADDNGTALEDNE